MSLEEPDLRYATIWSWWYPWKTASKGAIHKLNNLWHFCVQQWRGFMLDVSSFKMLCSTYIFHVSLDFSFILLMSM
jgi:hypothetical protein